MTDKPRRSRKSKGLPRFAFLTPDRIPDIAYAFYVVDAVQEAAHIGHATAGGETYLMALEVVRKFKNLSLDSSIATKDGQYIFELEQVIVSLARGILRRKRTLHDNEQTAEQRRTYQLRQMNFGYIQSAAGKLVLNLSRQALFPVLLALIGYNVTQGVDLKHISSDQQNAWSYVAALALAVGATVVSSSITQFKNSRVFSSYAAIRRQADSRYRQVASEEYKLARASATRLWEAYTGRKADEFLSFDGVNRVELSEAARFAEVERRAETSLPISIIETCRTWWGTSKLRRVFIRRTITLVSDTQIRSSKS